MNIRKPILIIILILAAAAALLVLQGGCKKKAPEPNVVLIVIDTLRADHLPFHGYEKDTAPFMTELASRNVVFDNAHSVSSWTAAATASIFTAMYPFQHGLIRGFFASKNRKLELHRIPDEIDIIPEVMKKNGYRTFGVAANVNICEGQGFTQGFDRFKRHKYKLEDKLNAQLKEWADDIKSGGKYFLYIHYNDPHQPYHRRKPFYWKRKDRGADVQTRYDSEIYHVDQKIKELYELFGWDKNTLLIITADHGEEFHEHKGSTHANTLYTEVLNVPLLVHFPGGGRTPKRIKSNVCTIDVLPTIKDYLHIEDDAFVQGISLMPLINGKENPENRRYLYPYLRTQKDMDLLLKAVIWKDWKYIFSNRGKKELFNMADDRREQNNLFDSFKDLTSKLFYQYNTFEKNSKKYKRKRTNIQLDEKKAQELKTLGYVE